jgi:hypothetical protein
VPQQKWLKLDNKVMKSMFIDYGTGVKEYKIWDIVAGKVLYHINVIFREFNSSPTMV